MPKLIGKHHDTFLINFVTGTNEAHIIDKERIVYGKSRAGYMLVCHLKIRIFSSNLQGILLIGQFRQEKNLK